jgi:hypothetical protein
MSRCASANCLTVSLTSSTTRAGASCASTYECQPSFRRTLSDGPRVARPYSSVSSELVGLDQLAVLFEHEDAVEQVVQHFQHRLRVTLSEAQRLVFLGPV